MILLSLVSSGIVNAQDFHFSQTEASPMYLNPAMTGLFKGDYRIGFHQRNQWSSFINRSYLNSALSFDTRLKKTGIGAYIINNRAGEGLYNAMTFAVSGAHNHAFKGNKYHNLSFGLQLGLIYKNVNVTKLVYEDQYDPRNGGSFTLPTNETFTNTNVLLPEVNVGLMYYYANSSKKINPFLGFSAFHLTEPNESFTSFQNKLPMRLTSQAGVKVNISERFQFLVHALGMQQKNVNQLMFSWTGYYFLKNLEAYLMYGTTRRTNDDAIVAHLGLKYRKFTYRLSYDVNTSSLQSVSRGHGGYEISIVYTAKKVNPTPVRSCPEL